MKDYQFQLHPPPDLLPGAALIDFHELFWNLEKTVEANITKWGWVDKSCGLEVDGGLALGLVDCGEPAEYWDRESGYRCRDHHPRQQEASVQAVGGYTGELDGTGSYEHPWGLEKGERAVP